MNIQTALLVTGNYAVWSSPFSVFLQLLTVGTSSMNVFTIINCCSCFVYLGSMMIEFLVEDIVNTRELNANIRTAIIEDKLKKWKQYYRLILSYFHQMNQCLGMVLLYYTTKTFISTVSFTFTFFYTHYPYELYVSSRFMLTHLVCFCILATTCHRIQKKVNFPFPFIFKLY